MLDKFSIGRLASLACLLEVSAPKPGNVHRGADFADVTFEDFLISAEILGNTIDQNAEQGIGETILAAVEATRAVVRTNTNLGMVLLVVPLAKAFDATSSLNRTHVAEMLESLDANDAASVYQAINHAKAGGMNEVEEMDLKACPPDDLIAAMKHAADRDMIARQYANGFRDVFEEVVSMLDTACQRHADLRGAIVETHVRLISRYGDSLIARKCGVAVSENARRMASIAVERLDENKKAEYHAAIADLDFWMRSDGNRRNPGTTADLIAAGLFVGFVNGIFLPTFSSSE